MTHTFDQDYWDQHWDSGRPGAAMARAVAPPNPHLIREVVDVVPGTALDAGCGAGAEAIWLASHGWNVTGVDISAGALAHAADRAAASGVADRVRWVQADLTTWEPTAPCDLVTTHYAHPVMPQLEFYDRVSRWVSPGGTLLIVGHRHHGHDARQEHSHRHGPGHGHGGGEPPASASVTADDITTRLDPQAWDVVTVAESQRTVAVRGGGPVSLHDVVVRATRRH